MIKVRDTKKTDGIYLHLCSIVDGTVRVGDKVFARVNDGRRDAIARNHSAAHLLQAALRAVLGNHVEQAGSLVDADKCRFDFTHFAALTREELEKVEMLVNTDRRRTTMVNDNKKKIKNKVSYNRNFLTVFITTILILYTLIMGVSMLWGFLTSFKDGFFEYESNKFLPPKKWVLDNYKLASPDKPHRIVSAGLFRRCRWAEPPLPEKITPNCRFPDCCQEKH